MNEKEILSSFRKVERLLDQQDPYKALEIIEDVLSKLNNKQLWFKGRAYFWKQLCYRHLLDLKNGTEAGRKGYLIFKKLEDKVQTSTILRDTAVLYENSGKFGKALEYINKSLDEIGDQDVLIALGVALAKKGKILSSIGDYKEAEVCFLAAEQVIDSSDHLMHRLSVSTKTMEFYVKQREMRKAQFYANKSELLLERLKNEKGYLNEVRYSQIQASKGIIAQSKGLYKEALMRFRNFLKFGLRPKRKSK